MRRLPNVLCLLVAFASPASETFNWDKAKVMKVAVYAVNAKRQRGPASTLVLRAPVARAAEKER